MKTVFERKFKSLDSEVYDTVKEAREADKKFKYELKQKKCKHKKVYVTKESRSDCIGYEMYERYSVYVKYCRICKKDVTSILGISESETSRYEARQRYNEDRREFRNLKKRFKS